MTENALFQILFYLIVVLACVKPLGWYMAQVYQGKLSELNPTFSFIERFIYRVCDVSADTEMNWKQYLAAILWFNLFGLLLVYALQRLQIYLPLNPQNFPAVPAALAFNTAASFVSNTDWQAYAGEATLSYFTQMMALTVQNFVSAATGMSLLMALIRGLVKRETSGLGNFWVDTLRGVLYILLPLSLVFALILVSQGVIQNYKPYTKVNVLQSVDYQAKATLGQAAVIEQVIPMGPVASQVAIKQLGSNGGGFFNTNSAHPFENPTPVTGFLQMLAILLIPASLCYTFGFMVNDKRQGFAVLLAMLVMFVFAMSVSVFAEQRGNPAFAALGIDQVAKNNLYPGGNMEGKETRFGIVNSAVWATATTATANGSVNSMQESLTPLGSLMPLWLMQLGEVVFGGVGCGLYGMLMLVIVTVFIAGLMVGRTPEYLGKKIEPFEMKMASIAVLLMSFVVLISTSLATTTVMGKAAIANPGAHGFTEILYAFTSMANNNGSAFAGLNANTPFYTICGGIVMLITRYGIAIPVLAIAGSLAAKKIIPSSSGTLATHTPLFIILLICVTLILGALSFFPALALGPIVEALIL